MFPKLKAMATKNTMYLYQTRQITRLINVSLDLERRLTKVRPLKPTSYLLKQIFRGNAISSHQSRMSHTGPLMLNKAKQPEQLH